MRLINVSQNLQVVINFTGDVPASLDAIDPTDIHCTGYTGMVFSYGLLVGVFTLGVDRDLFGIDPEEKSVSATTLGHLVKIRRWLNPDGDMVRLDQWDLDQCAAQLLD